MRATARKARIVVVILPVIVTSRGEFPRTSLDGQPRRLSRRGSVRFQAARFSDNILQLRQIVMLLGRGEWDSGIQAGNADDRSVEVVEGFFIDDGCDFSGEASGAGVLVKENHLVGL